MNSDDGFGSFFGAGAGATPPCSRSNYTPMNADRFYSEFFGFDQRPNFVGGGAAPPTTQSMGLFARNPEKLLACSLEDLYNGANKKINIPRKVVDSSGMPKIIKETLTVEIRPGWKKGTKVTFAGKGKQEPGFTATDLIIIIDEKPHEVFTREGNDLIINRKILLLEALNGKTIELTTLDGRNLVIPITEIVKPGYELKVPNEGMPFPKEPMKKGNLVIKFDVEYPTTLTTKQKYLLEKALAGNP